MMAMLTAGLSFFGSCDNIDTDDRFVTSEKPEVPIEEVGQTLLIQEFTGNMCVNCPKGAQMLHSIQETYPDNVIVVGMHPEGGGPNTVPIGPQDFRCEEAQAMYSLYQPSGFPCAVFNGTEKSTAIDNWMTLAAAQMGKIANLSISAECDYEESTRDLTVNYTLNFTHDVDDKLGVMVWIMENDIVGFQINDQNTLMNDYVHNHVLRASLNGVDGQTVGTAFKKGENLKGQASMKLDERWVAENCQVVVYVFNDSDKAVQQAAVADVVAENLVTPPHSVPQTLLVQEFTGNMCVNCPKGASELHSIQEVYAGQVIAVGMHPEGGGPNTVPIGPQDFRCDEAQVMYSFYQPSGFPCAVFNGTEKSTAMDEWFTIAANQIEKETYITLDAFCSYDSDTRNLTVDYRGVLTDNTDDSLSVMIWVMENDIVGFQINDQNILMNDYVHNHVLRASMNGDWGENIGSKFENGQIVKGQASMTLDSKWVAENCQVVVYVFKDSDKSVKQATVADVTSGI